VRQPFALLAVAVALGACGGSTVRQTAANGCTGQPTARHSAGASLGGLLPEPQGGNITSSSSDPTTVAQVCRLLGAPQRVTRRSSGIVIWHYGAGSVTFKGPRVVTLYNGYGAQIATSYPKK
jgi:hypothetical protein